MSSSAFDIFCFLIGLLFPATKQRIMFSFFTRNNDKNGIRKVKNEVMKFVFYLFVFVRLSFSPKPVPVIQFPLSVINSQRYFYFPRKNPQSQEYMEKFYLQYCLRELFES